MHRKENNKRNRDDDEFEYGEFGYAELPEDVFPRKETHIRTKRAKVHSEQVESPTEVDLQEEKNTENNIKVKLKYAELSVEGYIEKEKWIEIKSADSKSKTAMEDLSMDQEIIETNNSGLIHGQFRNKAFVSGYRAGGKGFQKGRAFDKQTPEDQVLYDQGYAHALEMIPEKTRNFNRGKHTGCADASRHVRRRSDDELNKIAIKNKIKYLETYKEGYHKGYDTYVCNHSTQLEDDKSEDSQNELPKELPSRAKVSGGGIFSSSNTSSTSVTAQQPIPFGCWRNKEIAKQEEEIASFLDNLSYNPAPK